MANVEHMNSSTRELPAWSPGLLADLTTAPDPGAAALRLAQAGVPVFPCVPLGKEPLTRRGFLDASADPSRVTHWWRRWPQANLAMPTGAPSGIVVVDVDVHATGNGFNAFERAQSAGLVDGWAWMVRTPSGGLHACYPSRPGVSQRCWQIPRRHVDCRGDGGYVVLPPSRVSLSGGAVGEYRVVSITERQPAPIDTTALRRFLDPPRPASSPRQLPPTTANSTPDRLAAWVSTRPEGARNQGLFWAACRMVEAGHDLGASLDVLGDAARAAGLSEREAETTIRSAYRTTTPHLQRVPNFWDYADGGDRTVRTMSMSPVVATAVAGTVVIATGAFWLSFTSLTDLARRSGIAPSRAWVWPLIVDGIIVVATVAVVALSSAADPRATWYPWLLLASGAAVSVAANALHAVIAADADVPGLVAAAVASVPPVVLLAITHLTVHLTRNAEVGHEPGVSDSHPPSDATPAETSPVDQRAEAEQLRLDGMSNRAIARHLGVHPSTVGRWLAPIDASTAATAAIPSKEQR
ncbi:MAG: bifunctional DNA primase/polymerase [Nocardioides sp.]|uniref:bifunctional DNA primase/polymerase n=1 Tax=Nocardioides sp. TaxID=35761 RepID=UPI0039E4A0C0